MTAVRALPTSPPAILLDAGNTVVFLDHQALAEIVTARGHEVDAATLAARQREATERYAARLKEGAGHEDGWRILMKSLIALAGVSEEDLEASVDAIRAEHDRFNLWRRVPDDVREALQRFRASGRPVAIVSNSEGQLDRLFARTELTDMFDLVVDSAIEGVRKPDPELFRRALSRLGLPPDNCIYAGDIPDVDVVGARAAGLSPVLIDALDQHRDYTDAPRFRSIAELADALGM